MRPAERLQTSLLQKQDGLGGSRHSIAAQLLGHTTLPPGQVARRLGYANASAFTRAFRRWNGMTPSEWRKKAGPDPVAASMDRKRIPR